MKTKDLKQVVIIKASSHDVYESLMDSKKHAKFTGDKAVISRKVGGKFSVFGGYAGGKNIELVQDKKIVQSWKASDWDDQKHYSTVTFKLSGAKAGTKLEFTHKGIPAGQFADIKQGWIDYYWKPLKKMLE